MNAMPTPPQQRRIPIAAQCLDHGPRLARVSSRRFFTDAETFVVPHEQLMPAARETALKIAQWPAASIKYSKRAMRIGLANKTHREALKEGWAAIMAAMAAK